ncbi:MAG TPA: hypothetical protein VK157_03280 [Phycisphaerales bacterium]|nr:hypothetical protein [Phycisphaerales bacterium]
MRSMSLAFGLTNTLSGALALTLIAGAAHAAIVPAVKVVEEGGSVEGIAGSAVSSLTEPATDAAGRVGYGAVLSGTSEVVVAVRGRGPVFRSSQVSTHTFSGIETRLAIAQNGDLYLFSSSIGIGAANRTDGIWGSSGFIANQTSAAFGIPNRWLRASSSPIMGENGNLAWISSLSSVAGGVTLPERGLFTSPSPSSTPAAQLYTGLSVLARDGTTPLPLSNAPGPDISFDHDISKDGNSRANTLRVLKPGNLSSTPIITIAGIEVASVGDAFTTGTFAGSLISSFTGLSINNAQGETESNLLTMGSLASGIGFVAVDGEPVMTATDTYGGITLVNPATPRLGGLTDDGRFAAVWGYTDPETFTTRQAIFVGPIDGSSPITLIAQSGDTLDFDNNGTPDADLISIPTPINRSWDLASDGMVYLTVQIADIGQPTPRNAIVGFSIGTVTAACDDIDFNNNDVFPEDQDVVDFFNVLAGADCPTCNDIDFNNNGVFPEDQDVIDFFNVLAGGTCPQ